MTEVFHFLRPWWLLALAPAAALVWMMRQSQDSTRAWRRAIDPHLLAALVTGQSRRKRLRPVTLLAIVWLLGVIALAGPTWSLEPSPFAEDQAALVIVLKVSKSMTEKDIQPSRLERAVQKTSDLLALRSGARAALVVYSGSTHLVMPLTRDTGIINAFASDLSPEIMPVDGDVPGKAIALANRQLTEAGVGGSIVLITDTLPPSLDAAGAPVHVLGVVGSAGADALESGAKAAGSSLTMVSADDRDVKRIARLVGSSFTALPGKGGDDGARWRDSGWWITPLLVLGCCFWFRPGWVVGWES